MRHRSRISETLALSALGRNLRRDGDLYRLFTLNDLDGQELTTALTATAAHRGIPLKPLTSRSPTSANVARPTTPPGAADRAPSHPATPNGSPTSSDRSPPSRTHSSTATPPSAHGI